MSEDPIGFLAGDANIRRYVGNASLSSIDPWGLAGYIHHGITNPDDIQTNRASGKVEVLQQNFQLNLKVNGKDVGLPLNIGNDKQHCAAFNLKAGSKITSYHVTSTIGVSAILKYDFRDVPEAERKNYYWHQDKNRGQGWESDGPQSFQDQKWNGAVLILTDKPGIGVLVHSTILASTLNGKPRLDYCFDRDLQDELNESLKGRFGGGNTVVDKRSYRSILTHKNGTVLGYYSWGLTITLALDGNGDVSYSVEERGPIWKDGAPQ